MKKYILPCLLLVFSLGLFSAEKSSNPVLRFNPKSTTAGIQKESICSPYLNSGMYTAMLECKDIMGMFVGHDHNNNYIGCLRNICLAYGNVSGRQCYGDIGRGVRVIELYEGRRKFDTWIPSYMNATGTKISGYRLTIISHNFL